MSSGDYSASTDSARINTTDFDFQNLQCPTCIDPPGDEGGGTTVCMVPDDYTLRATLNNTTASTITDDIPTWRLSPFWGGIIGELTTILENTGQAESPVHRELPYHQLFDLDRRVVIETSLMSNGQVSLSLTLYDMLVRVWYSSTNFAVSSAHIKGEADEIKIDGVYNIAQDNFIITDLELQNLEVDLNISNRFGIFGDVIAYIFFGFSETETESKIENVIKNQIANAIDDVNRNSPNMFLRSLINHPEIDNILPLLDQAIMELLQDDVSATLEVALPSCGDIDRDGRIDLIVST